MKAIVYLVHQTSAFPVGILYNFARISTPERELFERTKTTLTLSLSEKYRIIFSAFEPEPDAKIAILVIKQK